MRVSTFEPGSEICFSWGLRESTARQSFFARSTNRRDKIKLPLLCLNRHKPRDDFSEILNCDDDIRSSQLFVAGS